MRFYSLLDEIVSYFLLDSSFIPENAAFSLLLLLLDVLLILIEDVIVSVISYCSWFGLNIAQDWVSPDANETNKIEPIIFIIEHIL